MVMKKWNTLVGRILIVVGVLAVPIAAQAQAYPSRPIHLVVPYPPGGGIDPAARIYAQVLAEDLGEPVVIMNVAGASGQIGTGIVARAAPDGYTLLFASVAPNSILPAANPKLPYSSKDFVSVSLVGIAGYVLVVNPAVPARTVQELLALARTSPERIATFASSGLLGGPHLAGELLKTLGHVQMTHVPYRGDGPAVAAVIAGEVPLMFGSAPAVMPYVTAGQLRALAVSGGRRSAALPDVPALAELLPGHEVSQWYGLMVPTGTPETVVDKLHRATVAAVASSTVKEQFIRLGIEPTASSPEEFKAFVQSEIQKWKNVIREANISLE
jgi:tripartite-type tricarboxylate transporter receptor subunit TctC